MVLVVNKERQQGGNLREIKNRVACKKGTK
jgi:hypothetical protein